MPPSLAHRQVASMIDCALCALIGCFSCSLKQQLKHRRRTEGCVWTPAAVFIVVSQHSSTNFGADRGCVNFYYSH